MPRLGIRAWVGPDEPPHASPLRYSSTDVPFFLFIEKRVKGGVLFFFSQIKTLASIDTMATSAKDRVNAIGKQLAPAVVETATYEGIPPIKQHAAASNGPRAQGKVVIITGIFKRLLFPN